MTKNHDMYHMVTLTENIASKRLKKLLSEVSKSHHPIRIKGKKSNAVLISEDDWRAIEETLYLLSIPGMRKSIKAGLKIQIKECADTYSCS
jgi:antitoxin YefM